MVSSSFHLFVAGLGVDIFNNDNTRKDKKNNLDTKTQKDIDSDNNLGKSAELDRRSKADNLGSRRNTDVKADKKNRFR